MSRENTTPLLVQRLLGRELVSVISVVWVSCEPVSSELLFVELALWVGGKGCFALFTRCLAEARAHAPILGEISVRVRPEPGLDGIAESVQKHGPHATAEALQSLLVTVIEVLGRLTGDDMVIRLIEQSVANTSSDGGAPSERRQVS
jgi:hypothetical protein